MSLDTMQKCFVNSFLKFLKTQITHQDFSSDIQESLEVAIQCLEAAYEINPDEDPGNDNGDGRTVSGEGGGGGGVAAAAEENKQLLLANNIDLFELFQAACIEANPNKQKEAEDIKNDGNRLMKENKFYEALLQYNKAIRLDPTNPVFYCNRAAAYTRLNEFNKAVADCKMSLSYNPKYSKAYGRMGVAYTNLQKFDEAGEAYIKAIELEPNNQDYQNNLRLLNKRKESNVAELDRFLQNIPVDIDNPVLRALYDNLMSDPALSSTTSQMLSHFQNYANQNPNLVSGMRQYLSRMGYTGGFSHEGGGGGEGGGNNAGPSDDGIPQQTGGQDSINSTTNNTTQQQQQQQNTTPSPSENIGDNIKREN